MDGFANRIGWTWTWTWTYVSTLAWNRIRETWTSNGLTRGPIFGGRVLVVVREKRKEKDHFAFGV